MAGEAECRIGFPNTAQQRVVASMGDGKSERTSAGVIPAFHPLASNGGAELTARPSPQELEGGVKSLKVAGG
jgi:hypothetical protein